MFGCLSWRYELELVNVANVKISSSNVANFQLGIGIGIGNISTMATFTSGAKGSAPVLLDNPVLSHVGIIPKTRLLYQFYYINEL